MHVPYARMDMWVRSSSDEPFRTLCRCIGSGAIAGPCRSAPWPSSRLVFTVSRSPLRQAAWAAPSGSGQTPSPVVHSSVRRSSRPCPMRPYGARSRRSWSAVVAGDANHNAGSSRHRGWLACATTGARPSRATICPASEQRVGNGTRDDDGSGRVTCTQPAARSSHGSARHAWRRSIDRPDWQSRATRRRHCRRASRTHDLWRVHAPSRQTASMRGTDGPAGAPRTTVFLSACRHCAIARAAWCPSAGPTAGSMRSSTRAWRVPPMLCGSGRTANPSGGVRSCDWPIRRRRRDWRRTRSVSAGPLTLTVSDPAGYDRPGKARRQHTPAPPGHSSPRLTLCCLEYTTQIS